jgi:hypothetical protein
MNTLQPTWRPLVTRRTRQLHPMSAPRLVQPLFWGTTEQMLDMDLCEGRGSTAHHAPSRCMACLLDQWMVVSPANALEPLDRSLPLMSMGGGRS